ncbi:hypothetical protein NPIL_451181 [Nephila pilipes]|uniref:Uncharacterized protein n=1 Tax=Nephila pilipes TaxID=299642 RepID=A0A8X6NFX0_NEPPI|nr:hypothetical protein NPIL_451181 [Nephila pilipes]
MSDDGAVRPIDRRRVPHLYRDSRHRTDECTWLLALIVPYDGFCLNQDSNPRLESHNIRHEAHNLHHHAKGMFDASYSLTLSPDIIKEPPEVMPQLQQQRPFLRTLKKGTQKDKKKEERKPEKIFRARETQSITFFARVKPFYPNTQELGAIIPRAPSNHGANWSSPLL